MEIKEPSAKFYSIPKSTEGKWNNKSSATVVEDVTVTATASESVTLNTPTSKTSSAAPFNYQRVLEVKAALAAGRYPIDNQDLAQNIIAAHALS